MASKFHAVWNFLSHYKYLIVIVVGVLIVGVIDDNSFLKRIQYDTQISRLQDEIEHYEVISEENVRQLKELNSDPKAIEKIARERYFMKADDEDIFVFSEQ